MELWYSWQSRRFRHFRFAVRIQASATFIRTFFTGDFVDANDENQEKETLLDGQYFKQIIFEAIGCLEKIIKL